jgi:uroporphyrinogen decarboxylase
MITGMERLVAAISGKPSDRIPVFCNLIDQGARELGVPLQDYYADGRLVADAQLRMREKYGHDNVWGLFYVGKEAEALGCRTIRFADDGPPNVEHFVIQQPGDIARLQVPDDLAAHPAMAEPIRCMQILRHEVGGRYPICAYVSSTMTLPALLMGMDRWLELLLMGPTAERDALLEKCHEFFVKEVALYRAAGADVLIYSNPFGSTDTVSWKFLQSTSLPWIVRDVAAAGTAGLVYYCGMSRLNRVLDAVIEATGIGVFYLSPLDPLDEGKRIINYRGLTCGVINDARMVTWTPDETRLEVRRMLDLGMPGGRFLFGTGVMPYAIPETNIRAMLETAFEYGRFDRQGAA